MPSIPAGTKFHGVAPDVETENRGSALANAQRDVYTIEEINAGGGGGVTSIIAGDGISVDQSTGDVTVTATGGGTTGEILSLNLLTAPYSPGDYEGTVLSIGTATLILGSLYYLDGTGEWAASDASAAATSTSLMGMATASATAPDVLVSGIFQYSSIGLPAGTIMYISATTPGIFTPVAPTGPGEIVRVMGYLIGGSRFYFNPSPDWIVLV